MEIKPLEALKIEPFYDSPIIMNFQNEFSSIISQANENLDNGIFKAVVRTGIDIDKEKLIQALEADKKRYSEAYEIGYRRGYENAVRDCTENNFDEEEDL